MGLLTFALNVTLDGGHDHREMIADDELHDYFTSLIPTQFRSRTVLDRRTLHL